jgi:hypothetical protein
MTHIDYTYRSKTQLLYSALWFDLSVDIQNWLVNHNLMT